MKGELKSGGLALVVRSTDLHEVGRTVTLLRLVNPDEEFTAPDGVLCWWRECNPAAWLVAGEVQSNMPGGQVFYGWAVFPPTHLMPLDGDEGQFWAELIHQNKPAELTA